MVKTPVRDSGRPGRRSRGQPRPDRDHDRHRVTGGERSRSDAGTAGSLSRLQRRAGNRAVGRLLSDGVRSGPAAGAPDSRYEREAERVAETVLRTPETATGSSELTSGVGDDIGPLRRDAARTESPIDRDDATAPPAFRAALASLGEGTPLPESERAFFEDRFGRPFESVRIHRGGSAETAAGAIGARAFTLGDDIAFGRGQYRPGTGEGRRLLAHELTHTVQQDRGVDGVVQADLLEDLQRGYETVERGAGLYWNLDDEGAPFARDLMEHYALGFGTDFDTDPYNDRDWNQFMLDRPEIQRAVRPVLESIASRVASRGPTDQPFIRFGAGPTVTETVTGVRLNELESMRLTLHGAHRIDLEVNYDVNAIEGGREVIFRRIHMTWVDRGDMHPGTETELESGEMVDDAELTGAGSAYDIYIEFMPFGRTVYHVKGRSVQQVSGWPPTPGAATPGKRG